MAKAPYFPFYPGDWMKDPSLSMCAPATRGIWSDLLCVIHELNQGGTASGSAEQLARACRCTVAEFVAAADELAATGTADISQRNGRYHIHSRRMERDLKTRAEREAAGSAGGNAKRDNQRASKPPSKTIANAKQDDQQEAWQKDASSYSSSVSSSEERNTPPPPHGREAWRELPIVKENPPLADALAFWLANWPSLNGGPAGDEGRIEARLAEALGRGWSVEKIVRSIRFTITRPPAKRWLDPDDDFDSRPRGKRGARESAQFIPSSEL